MGIFGTATIGAPSRVPGTASGLWTWQRALAVGRGPSVVGGGGALTRAQRLHLLLGGDAHPPGIPWRLVNDAGESSCQAAGGVEPGFSSVILGSLGDGPVLLRWPGCSVSHQLRVMPATLSGSLTVSTEAVEVGKLARCVQKVGRSRAHQRLGFSRTAQLGEDKWMDLGT